MPELHERDQRVAAGEQLGVVPSPRSSIASSTDPARDVVERGGDHAPTLAAASTARTMLW